MTSVNRTGGLLAARATDTSNHTSDGVNEITI
jgi:hypothetical protein